MEMNNRSRWSFAEIGHLFSLAEAGLLTPEQLDRAAARAPLAPAGRAWRDGMQQLFSYAGVLLLAAGLIFFFAYNWDDLYRHARLGMALAALAACVAGAMFKPPFSVAWRAALLGACLTTGALLALIGQTYQSGADVWELFAAWAALMLPFVVLSRSSASWLLWLLVANLALLRGLSQSVWFRFLGTLGEAQSLYAIAAMNLAVLLLFEFLASRLLVRPRRHVQRLAALGSLAPLAFGAFAGWWAEGFAGVIPVFLALAGLSAWVYRQIRLDVPILAMTVFAAIAVFTSGLAQLLPREGFLMFNLVALFVIAASGLAAVWLLRLHRLARGGGAP